MTVQQFRKRPVVIEAMHLTADLSPDEVARWCGGRVVPHPDKQYTWGPLVIEIDTLEGVMVAQLGDWVIKGVANEFYPCKPDIFEATYEPVAPGGDSPEREIAPELIAALTELGNTYGPLGVALSAATLTNVAVLRDHLDPGYAPTVAEDDTPDLETVP